MRKLIMVLMVVTVIVSTFGVPGLTTMMASASTGLPKIIDFIQSTQPPLGGNQLEQDLQDSKQSDYPIEGNLTLTPSGTSKDNYSMVLSVNVKKQWEGLWQIVGGNSSALANSKAWITVLWAGIDGSYSEARKYTDIPIKDIAVSGVTSWEGNALNNRTIELKSTIRLPKDGIWYFKGNFSGNNWVRPLSYSYYIAVADGTAVPYYPDDLRSNPLAYLAYFDYGQITILPANAQRPFSLELDMARPPLAGEEVKMTFRAFSPFYDIKDFKAQTRFYKRTEDNKKIEVPATNIVVSSQLVWRTNAFGENIWKDWITDFKKNETRELVNVIKFPESGEWELSIDGDCVIPNLGYVSTGDRIQLTITGNKAYYGWKPKYDINTTPGSGTIELQKKVPPLPSKKANDLGTSGNYSKANNSDALKKIKESINNKGKSFTDLHDIMLENGAAELTNKRNAYGRTYKLPDGNSILMSSTTPIQFKNAKGDFEFIDNSIVADNREGSSYSNKSNSFSIHFPSNSKDKPEILFETGNGITITLAQGSNLKIADTKGNAIGHQNRNGNKATIKDNVVTYPECYQGITELYNVLSTGVKHNYIIEKPLNYLGNNKDSYLEFSETITLPAGCYLQSNGKIQTTDFNTAGNILVVNKKGGLIGVFPAPEAYEKGYTPDKLSGMIALAYSVRFLGDGQVNFTISVPVNWLSDNARIYPVVIDPSFYPTYSINDGYEYLYYNNGVWETRVAYDYTNEELYVGNQFAQDTLHYISYMRWQNIQIPKGCIITDVILHVKAAGDYSSPCSFGFYFEDADNADNLLGALPSSRSYVSSGDQMIYNTNWTQDTVYTISLPNCVQGLTQVINRALWAEGNSIGMKWALDNDAYTGYRTVYSTDHAILEAPILVVSFNTPPTVWITQGPQGTVPDTQDITFSWDGDDLESGKNLTYQYMLSPIQDTWQPATSTTTTYSSAVLKSCDDYVFWVLAYDQYGLMSEDAATCSFKVSMNLSGTWEYRPRGGGNNIPADSFLVFVTKYAASPPYDTSKIIAHTYTDSAGHFSFPQLVADNITGVSLHINASADSEATLYNSKIIVHAGYFVGGGVDTYPDPTDIYMHSYSWEMTNPFSKTIPFTNYEVAPNNNMIGAWWMKADLHQGLRFILHQQSLYPGIFVWDSSQSPRGTGARDFILGWLPTQTTPHPVHWCYYKTMDSEPPENRLYILVSGEGNKPSGEHKTDGASDINVTLHEMGHQVMDRILIGNDNANWGEAWADFWTNAVYGLPFVKHDLENLTMDGTPFSNGDNTTDRIRDAIWDIYDAVDDGYDEHDGACPLNGGFGDLGPIWTVICSLQNQGTARNFHDFINVFPIQNPSEEEQISVNRVIRQNGITYQNKPVHYLICDASAAGTITRNFEGLGTNHNVYPYGFQVLLRADPNNGYKFVNWTGNVTNPNNRETNINITDDQKVSAHYQQLVAPYITVSNTPGGSITSPTGGYAEGVPLGTKVVIAAAPTSGYRFVNWTGEVTTVENVNSATTNITVNGNYAIQANFVSDDIIPPAAVTNLSAVSSTKTTITLTWTAPGDDSTNGTANQYDVRYSTSAITDNATFSTATPATGVPAPLAAGTSQNCTVTGLSTNTTYYFALKTADEVPNWSTISNSANRTTLAQTNTYDLTISSTSGGDVTTPGEGTFTNYSAGTVVNLVVTPDSIYHFVNWTGDNTTIANTRAATTTIIMNGNYSIQANFAADIVTYTLNATAGTGGAVSVPGSGSTGPYSYGQTIVITASPSTGYHFVSWSGATGTIGNVNATTTTITLNNNYSITANFAANGTYSLTISTDGHGDVRQYSTTGPTAVGIWTGASYGQNTPPLYWAGYGDYFFSHWTGDTYVLSSLFDPNNSGVTITMLGEDTSINLVAHFQSNSDTPYHDYVTFTSSVGGTVSNPGLGVFGPYNDGEVTLNLVATPVPGYYFVNWTGDTSTVSNVNAASTIMDMYGFYNIKANFLPYTYNLNISAGSGGSVTTPGTGAFGPYTKGKIVTLLATPNAGYHFVNWTGDNTTIANTTSANTAIIMNSNYTIQANFAANTYSLTVNAGTGGTASANPTGPYTANQTVNILATSNSGYHFVNWTGDTATVASTTSANTTITMNGNHTIQANFAANTYSLTVNAGTGGTASANPTGPYTANQTVNILATSNSGYHFVNWTGDTATVASTTSANTTITMNGNHTIQANFAANTYSLTVNAGTGGTASANPTGPYTANQTVNILATSNSGYHFVNWTGDTATVASTTSANTTITMNGNHTIQANFAANTTPPSVNTGVASNVTSNNAILYGNLTSLGSASSVNVSFEWGLTTSYGSSTPSQNMTNTGWFYTPISGLSANTTYHYRAKAIGNGSANGTDVQFTTTAAPGNFLSGWGYRKQMVINGSSTGAQTNYQLKLNVYKGSGTDSASSVYLNNHVRTDFGDIRFTKADGTTLLDYWVESVNGDVATVWVEFDSIPASPTTATFFIYYGNSSATSASNGDNTFIFFDDFTGTTINTSKWTKVDTGSNISQNGTLTVSNGTATWGQTGMYSNANFDRNSNILIQGKYKSTAETGTSYQDTTMLWTKNSGSGVNYSDMIYGFYLYTGTTAIFDTWNVYSVADGASRSGSWTITEPTKISQLSTYHWNGGSGTPSGTMYIRKASDSSIVWQGSTTTMFSNTYHFAYPNVVLPANTYYVTCTMAAWSYNSQSGGVNSGFLKVSLMNTSLNMYEDGNARGTITPTWVPNTQYWIRQIIKAGGGATTQWSTDSDNWATKYDSSYSSATPLKVGFTHYQGGTVIMDDILIRKYVTSEPTFGTWGSETTPSTPYTLAVNTSGSGNVTRSPDQTSYTSGTVVTLTANAASGYTFTGWSGDLSGSTNPTTITMNANKTVTATFTPISNWLTGWGYRKQMVINGSSTGAQTNYQLKLNVYKGSGTDSASSVYLNNHVRTDFGDIRFTKADGTTLLDYWVESVNGDVATVWVEFDSIPASPTTATFFIYYGNSSATSASNGDNTFIFFDDFTGTTINTSKWTKVDTGSNISQNGTLTVSNGTATWGQTGMYSNANFDRNSNILIQGKYKSTAETGTSYQDTTMLWTKNSGSGVNYSDMIYGFYLYTGTTAIFDTWNVYSVADGASRSGSWTITEPTKISQLSTYHWNGGSGTPSGTMYIRKASDSSIVWQGSTTTMFSNTYHFAYPNVVLPANTYYVTCTMAAWSYNSQSGGVNSGFLKVSLMNTSLNMYEDGNARGTITPTWVPNTQYWIRQIIKAGGGATTQWSTDSDNWATKYDSSYSSATPLKVGFTHYQGGTVIMDDILIRKYVTSEPTFGTWGSETPGVPDTTPPAAVTNLAVINPTATSLTLTWTAPGDDSNNGTASQYDIRYSSSVINEGNWASATQVSGEPAPQVAGSSQNFTISGLSSNTTYYFAIKTADEVPNWSTLSNCPGGTTTAASGFPSGWNYRKQMTINGSSTGAQTNYQLKLNVYKGTGTDSGSSVYLNNHCQNDFSDIRFTKADGTSILDYWRESYVSGTSAVFWIEFDSIPASPGTVAFYIYYGASGVSTTSNARNTMWLYEDFEDLNIGDINGQQGWYGTTGSSSTTKVVTGQFVSGTKSLELVRAVSTATATAWKAGAVQTKNLLIEVRMKATDGPSSWHRYLRPYEAATNGGSIVDMFVGGSWQYYDTQWNSLGVSWTTGTWYKVKVITKDTNKQDIYIDDVLRASNANLIPVTNGIDRIYFLNQDSGINSLTTTYYDDLIVRKYVSAEPTFSSWGSETPLAPDTTPPAAVTDLAAVSPTSTSLTLTWHSPGDDSNNGTATAYDIRYSTSSINATNWASATQVSGEPAPQVAGSSQNFTISGLSSNTTYYFAIKTADEVPNWSTLSNCPGGTTTGPLTLTLRPNAAGDYTNLSYQDPDTGYHWDKVDEATPDGYRIRTDFGTVYQADVFNLPDPGISANSTIISVRVYFRFMATNQTYYVNGYCRPILRLGSAEMLGTIVYGAQWATYQTYSQVLSRPGGGAWSVSDLNALQVGIGMQGPVTGEWTACDQVYVVVEYLPSP